MTNISVVIITFNEENNIARCIDSVLSLSDDIVVVDSFSTDNTEQICKQKGVRFVQHAFKGHIEQKNWAITQAKNKYVLSLDADEALDEKLIKSILQIKKDLKYDGYTFNRLNNYCGTWVKHTGWYPDKKLRLWNSTKGKWTGENPHDRFEMTKEANIGHLKGDILHYTYTKLEDHIAQIQKFTTIAAQAKFKKGKKISVLMILLRPLAIFLKKYIMKLGILDGYHGFVISVLSAYTTFLKDIKLKELHKGK